MSDKDEKLIKISVRVPEKNLKFSGGKYKKAFKNKSDFVNQALVFFNNHLETLRSFEFSIKEKKHRSNETILHSKLKQIGFSILANMKCKDIQYEKEVSIKGKNFKIDVWGITYDNNEIAIECWASKEDEDEKIDLIQTYFSKYIVLTIDDLIEYYEDLLQTYKQALDNISSTLDNPIVLSRVTKETQIEKMKQEGLTFIHGTLMPLKQVKESLLNGNEIVIDCVDNDVMASFHTKLRAELAKELKYKFKLIEKRMTNEKGKTVCNFSIKTL